MDGFEEIRRKAAEIARLVPDAVGREMTATTRQLPEAIRRDMAEAARRTTETRSLLSMAQEHVAAQQAMQEINERALKHRAEQAAVPRETRDGVLRLNERIDGMLDMMRAQLRTQEAQQAAMESLVQSQADLVKSQADEAKQSESRTLLTRGILLGTIAVIVLGILTLLRTYHGA